MRSCSTKTWEAGQVRPAFTVTCQVSVPQMKTPGVPSIAGNPPGLDTSTWLTGIELVSEALAPLLSVTVRRTEYEPGAEKTWLAVAPVPVVPSPKLQAYETIVPSGSWDAVASNVTDCPAVGPEGDEVNDATGVWFAATLELPYANADGAAVTAQSARAFGRDLAEAIRQHLAAGPA